MATFVLIDYSLRDRQTVIWRYCCDIFDSRQIQSKKFVIRKTFTLFS